MARKGAAAFHSTLEAARELLLDGFSVVPIPYREKAPRVKAWQTLRLREEHLPVHFSGDSNIGVLLGEASGNIVDVDGDSPIARQIATRLLPHTDMAHGRATSRDIHHWWYICDPPPQPEKFSDLAGTSIIELRSTGQQTIVPPSIHPSGEPLEWIRFGNPAPVNAAVLRLAVAKVAAASLLADNWPNRGARNDAANALAGMLLREAWPEEEVVDFVKVVAEAAGDEQVKQRVRDVLSTAKRLAADRTATGAATLASIIGDAVVRRVRLWIGIATPHMTAASWVKPASLGDELPPVPPLDLQILPSSFRPLIEDISERMQVPADYATAAVIVALAGCVNRRAVIVPKRADTSWRVVPNLWGAIVAQPGMMKSPILRAVTQPLTRIEELWRAEFESVSNDFTVEKEQAELRWQAWREQYKQAVKRGGGRRCNQTRLSPHRPRDGSC